MSRVRCFVRRAVGPLVVLVTAGVSLAQSSTITPTPVSSAAPDLVPATWLTTVSASVNAYAVGAIAIMAAFAMAVAIKRGLFRRASHLAK